MLSRLWSRLKPGAETRFFARFDRVYCLSLAASADRRERVLREFAKVGLKDFEFFEATDKDDPEVEEYFRDGKVAQYPPCFRCGKLSCGDEDCNNVLIPAQVATFISHQRIWRAVAEGGFKTALILEDDAAFPAYAAKVLRHLESDPSRLGSFFEGDVPCLLRLGWALSHEHAYAGRVEVRAGEIRMSNPCYAINRGMARRLLDEFEVIDSAVDGYIHRKIGPTVENYTLFPPVAHDLSWSLGEFDSLIHPKSIRADYLKRTGAGAADPDAVRRAEQSVRDHAYVKHVFYRDYLLLGCPGLDYAPLIEAFGGEGIEIGMDGTLGREGVYCRTVPGQASPAADPRLVVIEGRKVYFGRIIVCAADPATAIGGIVKALGTLPGDPTVRALLAEEKGGADIENLDTKGLATLVFLAWTRRMERVEADGILRLGSREDWAALASDLRRWRGEVREGTVARNRAEIPVAGAAVAFDAEDLHGLPASLCAGIAAYCRKYGYVPAGKNQS